MYPMGMVTQRMTQGRWRSKLFTTSTTFVVPPDVEFIWVDGVGGGGGGGGGNATPGGGGGGGSPSQGFRNAQFPVTPGESLRIAVGDKGIGGSAGSGGTSGSVSTITGANDMITSRIGYGGAAGANPNGGNGGANANGGAGAAGGAGAGTSGILFGFVNTSSYFYGRVPNANFRLCSGSAGGALSNAGGNSFDQVTMALVSGAAGNASGGGGGHGGSGEFGSGGQGGANGAAGNNATGYGAGGGGGSGNANGGDGSPGFIRIYCFTAYQI